MKMEKEERNFKTQQTNKQLLLINNQQNVSSSRSSLSLSIKQTPKRNSKYLQNKFLTASVKKYKNYRFIGSPLQRIRINISHRQEIFEFSKCSEKSFEANQSFPKIKKHNYDLCIIGLQKNKLKDINMERIRVDGSNGLRFPLRRKGYYTPGQAPGQSSSYSNSLIASQSESNALRDAKANINPNKAVFTIDSKTSQILIVNNKACQLLGYSPRELANMLFSELLLSTNKSHVCALAEVQLNSEDGTIVLLSGKVVEMNTKQNTKVAVSLWIRQIDGGNRCLAVAEPVERRVCQFVTDRNGTILSADYESLVIFQFETLEKLIGMDITYVIPAIQLPDGESSVIPKFVKKQKATGKTGDGSSFPLCLLIKHNVEGSTNTSDLGLSTNQNQYLITVWVFQNLSGLIVLDDLGIIESCNHHFSMLMFGYPQPKIIGQQITKLIPNFGQDFEYMEINRSRNVTDSSLDKSDSGESGTETDAVCLDSNEVLDENYIKNEENVLVKNQNLECEEFESAVDIEEENFSNDHIETELLTPVNDNSEQYYNLSSQNSNFPNSANDEITPSCNKESSDVLKFITSTPDLPSEIMQSKFVSYVDGKYKGEAIHSDGNVIDILYTISNQHLPCGRKVSCVWICRDPDTVYVYDDKHQNLTLTFNSINSTIEHSLGQAIKNTAAAQNYGSRPNSVLLSQYEDDQWLTSGEFSKYYSTLKQIGKGAYGYVKMAYRNSDRLLVVAKFILKDKLCPQFLISTDDQKDIPMEIYLLTTVKHPNIVTVHDVFENEKFFQLIMEKHGSGMDLFEFIDRRPLMDEKLGSYIFRQIVDAVDYLHKNSILHRDIKDENIIIDQNFHIKLIDFGSATFMEEGKLFSTFFGTTEYCSPEVLAGNKYAGPELEVWSLGVTLYVLIFFENPFIDIEETLRAELIFPHKISSQLEKLLYSMLNKDPKLRCSVQQLSESSWINQEVNSQDFNFAQIVPCELHEAKPDKYFSGQSFSNNLGGGATDSPQNSLSLVDGDSMIDGDDDQDDEDERRSEEIELSPNCVEDKITANLSEMFAHQKLVSFPEELNNITTNSETSSNAYVTGNSASIEFDQYLQSSQDDLINLTSGSTNKSENSTNFKTDKNFNSDEFEGYYDYDSWEECDERNESFS